MSDGYNADDLRRSLGLRPDQVGVVAAAIERARAAHALTTHHESYGMAGRITNVATCACGTGFTWDLRLFEHQAHVDRQMAEAAIAAADALDPAPED